MTWNRIVHRRHRHNNASESDTDSFSFILMYLPRRAETELKLVTDWLDAAARAALPPVHRKSWRHSVYPGVSTDPQISEIAAVSDGVGGGVPNVGMNSGC